MIEVDALMFDLDGTLIDSKRDLYRCVIWLQSQYGAPRSTEEEVASFVGDGVTKLVQRALVLIPNVPLRRAVDQYKAYYRLHCLDHTKFYTGVVETIEAFRGKKLAVITNKPVRASQRILAGLGLLGRFADVVGGDSLRRKKPDPAPVLKVLHELKVSNPRRAVMVGDGPNDILSGRAAGVWTCAVLSNITPRGQVEKTQPDFVLKRIAELRFLFH